MLITRPFVLLRFHAPEYSMDDERGVVRWRILDGILVASEGHEGDGFLEIDVRKCPEPAPGRAKIHVEVEIASFYPRSPCAWRAGSTPTPSRASTSS